MRGTRAINLRTGFCPADFRQLDQRLDRRRVRRLCKSLILVSVSSRMRNSRAGPIGNRLLRILLTIEGATPNTRASAMSYFRSHCSISMSSTLSGSCANCAQIRDGVLSAGKTRFLALDGELIFCEDISDYWLACLRLIDAAICCAICLSSLLLTGIVPGAAREAVRMM